MLAPFPFIFIFSESLQCLYYAIRKSLEYAVQIANYAELLKGEFDIPKIIKLLQILYKLLILLIFGILKRNTIGKRQYDTVINTLSNKSVCAPRTSYIPIIFPINIILRLKL